MAKPDPNDPAWDRLRPDEKVSDEDWDSVMAGFSDFDAVNSEISADETADRLAEQEGWTPPAAPPIGIRTAKPALVLSACALIVGVLGLVLGAMFFRGMPGLLTAFFIVCTVGGLAALFFFLPKTRRPHDGDGAEV